MSSRQLQDLRITPQGSSTFEHVVRRLRLTPSEYASSIELKEWVRQNKDEKYVPPELLALWGFEVKGDISEELLKKLLKRTA